jgi:hypothetical protein
MAAPIVNMKAQTVSTNKTLTFQYLAINNSSATDPASGESSVSLRLRSAIAAYNIAHPLN